MSDAYRQAGVDIDAADQVVERIKTLAAGTRRPGVISDIGGFGGLFSLMGRFRDPVLVSGTDGVGTKLLVAQRLGRHDTIGIDLVAMCVNDVLVCGAEPLFFLDYFATGKLAPEVATAVIAGIAEGCKQARSALLGGELAEMPGMYAPGHYDLAGFSVGAVERDAILDGSQVRVGDRVVGVPSSGLHSNGYSLVRKLTDDLPGDTRVGARRLDDELMVPTRIYVETLDAVRRVGTVHAMAHITGGGLLENIPRVLPPGAGVMLKRHSWEVPAIFPFLQARGSITDDDMHRTFNCGVGLCVVVAAAEAEAVARAAGGTVIGEVVADPEQRVVLQ